MCYVFMYALFTNLDGSKRNLLYIKDKKADQPAERGATPYSIHVLPLFNRSGRDQHIFKNICISKRVYAVEQLVEALRYKLKGHGFDSR